ncbi:aminotransferase class I/II-fold pyridoxal phosphate-dependent enzyme [Gudongella sp. DL1XJH-153]|uniref:methionine gamma-lyase family protein n=1 Tax=Gudongella sp. DL1XJH-153 TaxID=3409804 RepID=UPI003BB619C6
MNKLTIKYLCKQYDVNQEVIEFVNDMEARVENRFKPLEEIREFNQYKVIGAMQDNRLGSTDFHWTTGYGYGDIGREKVESIFAAIFKAEAALVRPAIASGTHALNLVLSGILRPGDQLLYITGTPYDTLLKVIGKKGSAPGSLMDYGVLYNEVPLLNNGIDIENVLRSINNYTKIIAIQRSTGYSDRRALTIDEMESVIHRIKKEYPDVIIMVDNCYGEFLDTREPIEAGADIIAGSLIKNPGGGLALSGGYAAGREDLIDIVANRLTAPGLGKDTGLTFGTTRTTLQGLFMAPHVVAEAVKGALLVAMTYKSLGFNIVPKLDDKRSDIIQGIEFLTEERVSEFCKGIQAASTVDSYVVPEAWDMPGYADRIIMAAGGFIEGSSIELSADGPMREPYYAYYQGGLTYDHCKLGVIKSLDNLYRKKLVDLAR